MLTFAIALLLVSTEALSLDATQWLIGSAFVFFIVSTVIVHFKRTIPLWGRTYSKNTARKIDLRTAVFSVTTEWADSSGSATPAQRRLIFGLTPIVGALGMMLFNAALGPSWDRAFFAVGSLMLLVIASFWGSEAYHAYKLWELEHQIGKQIVMDGYQEERTAEGQADG